MWSEFKKFAVKGNVLDLAVAVIIGGAFGKIVTSLVENIMMPLLGIVVNGIDFTNLAYTFRDADVMYGAFLQSVFDFLVMSLTIFFFMRIIARLKSEKDDEKEKKPSKQEELLTEIRDLLKQEDEAKKVHFKQKQVSIKIASAAKNKRDA